MPFNPLTPELNPSAQRCLTRFLLGILLFKWLLQGVFISRLALKGYITKRTDLTDILHQIYLNLNVWIGLENG
jgi:hypothetical protein